MNGSDEPAGSDARVRLDLRGVACPLNWARAKARLETMQRGELIELLADDPRAGRDIPVAAETEGYFVLSVGMITGVWHILIER